MQFPQMFDARTVEPSQSQQLVPAGDYPVVITESGPEETKAKDGGMLRLICTVLQGHPNAGHVFIWNLNLWNKSQQSVEIAYRQLSALCHVTGRFQISDSSQLHGVPFIAIVSNDGTYNNVKGVKDINGNLPGKAAAAPASQPTFGAPQPPPMQAPQPPQQPQAPAWAQPPQQAPQQAPQPPVAQWGPPPPTAQPSAPAPAAPSAPWQQQAPPATPPWAMPPQQQQPQAPMAPTWPPTK